MSKSVNSLKPTTPASSPRYDSCKNVEQAHRIIAPRYSEGECRPRYSILSCIPATNPEGKVYFVLSLSVRFITEQSMYDPEVQEHVLSWASAILEILKEKALSLPPTAEIYISLSEDRDTCFYYIADHAAKTLAWLEPVSSEDICVRPAVSDEHLTIALEELYWNHLEYYSAHECGVIDLREDMLCSVLIQCKTDQLTSEDSTFPFPAQKCDDFLRVVQNCRAIENLDSSRVRWSIARIWALVCNHRFMTHYGQENARLSRDQLILNLPEVQEGKMFTLKSRMLFNIPQDYNTSFEKLWADEIVYQGEWRDFIPKCHDEWTLSTVLSFGLLLCNLVILNSFHGSVALARISTGLSTAAVLAGTVLLTKHQNSGRWTAAYAASYLSMARHDSSGFQNLACQFSVPRALLLWALGIFSIQVPFLFTDMTDRSMVVILGSVSALCFIFWIFHILLNRCWSLIRNVRQWKLFGSRSIQLDDTLPY